MPVVATALPCCNADLSARMPLRTVLSPTHAVRSLVSGVPVTAGPPRLLVRKSPSPSSPLLSPRRGPSSPQPRPRPGTASQWRLPAVSPGSARVPASPPPSPGTAKLGSGWQQWRQPRSPSPPPSPRAQRTTGGPAGDGSTDARLGRFWKREECRLAKALGRTGSAAVSLARGAAGGDPGCATHVCEMLR